MVFRRKDLGKRKFCVKFVWFSLGEVGGGGKQTPFYPEIEKSVLLWKTGVGGGRWTSEVKDGWIPYYHEVII